MDPEMLRFLQRQEEEEGTLYQSASAIEACIDGDFSNAGELLRVLGARQADLAGLFRAASLVPFAVWAPVPVRTCDRFQIHKHTLRQLPYLHRHDFYELVYVLRGRMEISYGKNTYLLEEGDSIYYDSIVPHHVHGYQGEAAQILAVVYTPA